MRRNGAFQLTDETSWPGNLGRRGDPGACHWFWPRRAGIFLARESDDLFLANVPVLIVALGMTLVILTGQIDISVGSIFAICGVSAGVLAKAGLPAPLAALGRLSRRDGARRAQRRAGRLRPDSIDRGHARDHGRAARRAPMVDPGRLGSGSSRGLSMVGPVAIHLSGRDCFLIAVILSAAAALGPAESRSRPSRLRDRFEPGGRASGGNPTRHLVTFSVFAITGALTGLAAALNSVRFNQIPSNAGLGLEMKVIAAVVVGGAAITGGSGTIARNGSRRDPAGSDRPGAHLSWHQRVLGTRRARRDHSGRGRDRRPSRAPATTFRRTWKQSCHQPRVGTGASVCSRTASGFCSWR